jgi:TonB-linked SusC/RagA family outer membrane protein
MRKFLIYQVFLFLSTLSIAYGQGRQITGVVQGTDSAIVAASIIEKGVSSNGTATDNDGRFRLTLKGTTNTIIVSSVGFTTQEVKVGNQANITVTLVASDAKGGLDEVVVVGYGRQKKLTLTGSVSTVSGADIRQNPSASLQNTLAGRLPGFYSQQTSGRPGSDGAAFFIRGQSSFNAGANSPLIIVDDIEFTYDQFARIDPNEIESLSILKDASTTAVYGIRGANGVVVVTTRRGKIGPAKVSLRTEYSLQQPSRIPKFLDAYESAKLYTQAQINDGQTRRFSDADLELFKNGTDPYGHPNVDWKDVLFKKYSTQTRGNLDISGGTDRVKYFVSAGYLFQDGILKNYSKDQGINSNYYHKRYNYRSNLDMKVTKDLDLRLDLYGNIGQTNNPNVGSPFGYNDIFYEYSSFLSLSPFAYPVYNPDGSFGYSAAQTSNANYNTNNVVGRLTHYGYNRDNENNMNFVASAVHKLDFITKGLSLKGTVSYASTYYYTRSTTRDQFPSFIYTPATATAPESYVPRDPNIYRVRRFFLGYNARSTTRTVNLQGLLNYDRTFGDHHAYGLLLYSQNSYSAAGNATYNFIPNNFLGVTTRIGYDYKQKYLLQFNGARNGSDRFAADNRFGIFPAVSAGWNVSEEGFFKKNVSFVDRLKVRASYGIVGNDKLGNSFTYFYLPEWTNSGSVSFGQNNNSYTGVQEGRLGNPNVSWESEKKFDVGLEFAILKNKLNATVEYFNNNRYDILTNRGTVSALFGQSLPPVNLGRVNNKGYEFEINYRGTIGKDFNFNVKGTYSYAKNKILQMDEPSQLYPYQAFTGNSIGQILVYNWVGFYKDQDDIAKSPKTALAVRPGDLKYEDVNNDGLINDFDKKVMGFPNVPNTTAGISLGMGYKNFSFNVLFQGSMNFNVRGAAEAIRAFSSNALEVHTQAWTPTLGDNAQYPLLSFNTGISDPSAYPSTFWLVKGDFIRLKTAELSYTLPKSLINRLKVQDLRIYTNGYNLLTWSKLDKRYEFDPEITSGTDRINYPPQRMFNFGLSVTF